MCARFVHIEAKWCYLLQHQMAKTSVIIYNLIEKHKDNNRLKKYCFQNINFNDLLCFCLLVSHWRCLQHIILLPSESDTNIESALPDFLFFLDEAFLSFLFRPFPASTKIWLYFSNNLSFSSSKPSISYESATFCTMDFSGGWRSKASSPLKSFASNYSDKARLIRRL